MTVKLRWKNLRYRDLTPGVPYLVIGIEGNDLRLLNDADRPYLYPAAPFDVLERREPEDWETEYGEDGEPYAYPPPLKGPGFFEDFFDNKPRAVKIFWNIVNRRLAAIGRVA